LVNLFLVSLHHLIDEVDGGYEFGIAKGFTLPSARGKI